MAFDRFLAVPMEVRLAALAVLGVCAGAAVNAAVDRLRRETKPVGPWRPHQADAPPRRAIDRVPLLGWWMLRREAPIHGAGFWLRPMFVELACAAGLAALYWWEVGRCGLLPDPPAIPSRDVLVVLHGQYAAHALLALLMLAASLIDFDEKTIPDEITVPGTLAGLVLAAAMPWCLLPEVVPPVDFHFWQAVAVERWPMVTLVSPAAWPESLGGFPRTGSLLLGVGCFWAWCAAILPRTWYSRHGLRRAVVLCCARIARERASYRIAALAVAGAAGIAAVWYAGGQRWVGLLSALVGMAAAGGLVWAVRLIASAAMDREAMGFGDVTLMAMLGTLLGWQACLLIFLLAPLAGLVFGVVRLLVLRDHEIPYGPFLCLAAAAVVVRWADVWDVAEPRFAIGWLVPALVLVCLVLMGGMLKAWKAVKTAAAGDQA
jgi:leader peptidase (prepilin peptidase) / N-methyltransferase